MVEHFIFPQTSIFMAATAVAKLRRTRLGRLLIKSDEVIVDRVKYDPDDDDRIWIGTRRTAIMEHKHRTLACSIDDFTFADLERAANPHSGPTDTATLAAFGLRLYDCFVAGRTQCPFIQERTPFE